MSKQRSNTSYDPERYFGQPGTVYLIVREHFAPGLVKVGLTTRAVTARVAEANRTAARTERAFGVADYRSVFALPTMDCGQAEKLIHERLEAYRVAGSVDGKPLGGQEWFRIGVQEAIEAVTEVIDQLDKPQSPSPDPAVLIAASEAELEEHEAVMRGLEEALGPLMFSRRFSGR